jgi:hypothetical protein
MGIWNKLFRRNQQPEVMTASGEEYREEDNMGTRHDTFKEATAWWVANLIVSKGPFLVYTFASNKDARASLLDTGFMHEAQPTGKIICTEALTYGFYQLDDGAWEVEIVGKDFTYALWTAAKSAMMRHGGICKNEEAPEKTATNSSKAPSPSGKVTFIREEHQKHPLGSTLVYRIYRAASAEEAKQFLQAHPVDKPLLYLVVETPDGNYCRDKDGIYKE